jgi:hypothetical protein
VAIKISQKIMGLQMIKCNIHEIRKLESFKYLGIQLTNGNVKEEITEWIKGKLAN